MFTNLVDVLALELRDELLKALLIGVNTNGLKDRLDVRGRGGGVAGKAEEEVGCEVLHFECVFCAEKVSNDVECYNSSSSTPAREEHVQVNALEANKRVNRFNREVERRLKRQVRGVGRDGRG